MVGNMGVGVIMIQVDPVVYCLRTRTKTSMRRALAIQIEEEEEEEAARFCLASAATGYFFGSKL